jgi:ParB family chromosome partitioning protein
MKAMDLSGLAQFKASDLLSDATPGEQGKPLEVDLKLIDFDSLQPRRDSWREDNLAELAASIKTHGVLEPVTLRSNPDLPGRYIINRGERRVRASRLAGKKTVPAFIDERMDRFAQAIENLQREDLTPFDLATFIAERQAEDPKLKLADIAEKLHKPRSFITEAAGLIEAPAEVRRAFDAGRVRDTRSLYLMARAWRDNRTAIEPLLNADGAISRDMVETAVRGAKTVPFRMRNDDDAGSSKSASAQNKEKPKKLGTALLVEYKGRRARLGWTRQPTKKTGEIVFDDGERKTVGLTDLTLLSWTTR